jgi:NAD(P)-dependent dehydrogenase (short-subunit alcohol dehydrogenase family)
MFDKQSDINFKGTFFTVQKSLPYLNDGAAIVLLSSVVNEKGIPNHASYAATKAAVRSLGRSFAAELIGRKVRVNVLTPALSRPMHLTRSLLPEKKQKPLKPAWVSLLPLRHYRRLEKWQLIRASTISKTTLFDKTF